MDIKTPIKIKEIANVKVRSISLGQTHACCTDEQGRLFTWGLGGGLGHGLEIN